MEHQHLAGLKPEEEDEEQVLAKKRRGEALDIKISWQEEILKILAIRFVAEGGSKPEPVAKKTMPLLDMGGTRDGFKRRRWFCANR